MHLSSCNFRLLEDPGETNGIYRHIFDENGRYTGFIDVNGFFHRSFKRRINKRKVLYGIIALFCCIISSWLFGYHSGQSLSNKQGVEQVGLQRQVGKLPADIGYILP